MIIILIFLCFAFSLSSVSASDNAGMDNVTMVDDEIELKDSKIIEILMNWIMKFKKHLPIQPLNWKTT